MTPMQFPDLDTRLLTPTQLRLLVILSDGEPHSRYQLRDEGLWDELGSVENVKNHIAAIRRHLRKIGQDIVCVLIDGQKISYQRVVKYRKG